MSMSTGLPSSSSAPGRSAWPPPRTSLSRRLTPLVLEAGPRSATASGDGGTSACSRRGSSTSIQPQRPSLARDGWTMPPGDEFPTGHELVDRYLEPLAASRDLAPHIRLNARVDRRRAAAPRSDERRRPAGRAVPRARARRRGRAGHPGASRDRRLGHHREARRARRIGLPALGERASADRASSTAFPMCSARSGDGTPAGACWSRAAGTRR